mmetsp:Transcript_31568/g.100581  ORF Transcript_31568/g.100581 Transcript_31568/m.100581 type:complete len:268 (-) Transcript_31568:1317-2120(-)
MERGDGISCSCCRAALPAKITLSDAWTGRLSAPISTVAYCRVHLITCNKGKGAQLVRWVHPEVTKCAAENTCVAISLQRRRSRSPTVLPWRIARATPPTPSRTRWAAWRTTTPTRRRACPTSWPPRTTSRTRKPSTSFSSTGVAPADAQHPPASAAAPGTAWSLALRRQPSHPSWRGCRGWQAAAGAAAATAQQRRGCSRSSAQARLACMGGCALRPAISHRRGRHGCRRPHSRRSPHLRRRLCSDRQQARSGSQHGRPAPSHARQS